MFPEATVCVAHTNVYIRNRVDPRTINQHQKWLSEYELGTTLNAPRTVVQSYLSNMSGTRPDNFTFPFMDRIFYR
jgi:hypothetical protein